MHTHDPFQNFQTLGAYSGGATQFGLPISAIQPSVNPFAFAGQQLTNPLMGAYGQQPLQGLGIGGQQNPLQQLQQLQGLQNPLQQLLQNPLQQLQQQNPFQQFQYNPLQQLQQQNPLQQLLQNPWVQQAITQSLWQNPMLASSLQQQIPQYGGLQQQQIPQYGFQQQQPQFNYPLAPQSLIGAGGIGQQFGQMHPLAQLALRQATGYGISPLAGCF